LIKNMSTFSPITQEILNHIREAVGAECLIRDPKKMVEFGKDASEYVHIPDLVIEATTSEQVQALLRLANQYRFPVTPRGLGTGLAGGAVPVFGGVVLSLAGEPDSFH